MNLYISVGYSPDGKAKILAGPDVSYSEHKELLRNMDGKGYERAELWSRSSGKIKQRRLKVKADKKLAKVNKPIAGENKEDDNEK